MLVLDAGVDSLYWSAKASVGPWYVAALAARDAAKIAGDAVPWREVRGYSLSALPHGRSFYPFAARAAEFEVRLTDADKVPSAYVQLRSPFIRAEGVEKAAVESVAAVAEITGGLGVPKASRIDVYADIGGFGLRSSDRAGFHTRADVAAYFPGGEDDLLPSVRFGGKAFKVRVYDKRRELQRAGKPAPLAWGDFAGPVTRVEVEADAAALRRFGILTLGEALTSYGDVWRHGTTRFVVLRVPGAGEKRDWPIRDEWRVIQSAGIERFPANGLVPFAQVKGEKIRVLRVLYGCLASLGAYLGIEDLEEVVRRLPFELRGVLRGREFKTEVVRREKRLPRAVRERRGQWDS